MAVERVADLDLVLVGHEPARVAVHRRAGGLRHRQFVLDGPRQPDETFEHRDAVALLRDDSGCPFQRGKIFAQACEPGRQRAARLHRIELLLDVGEFGIQQRAGARSFAGFVEEFFALVGAVGELVRDRLRVRPQPRDRPQQAAEYERQQAQRLDGLRLRMMPLVRNLLRHHVDDPEHGDADDRYEEQHDPRQHVCGRVEGFALEECGLRGAALSGKPRRGHDDTCRPASPPRGPFDAGTHGLRVLDKPVAIGGNCCGVEQAMRVAAMVITGGRIVFAFLDTRDSAMSRYARTHAEAATRVIAIRVCNSRNSGHDGVRQ